MHLQLVTENFVPQTSHMNSLIPNLLKAHLKEGKYQVDSEGLVVISLIKLNHPNVSPYSQIFNPELSAHFKPFQVEDFIQELGFKQAYLEMRAKPSSEEYLLCACLKPYARDTLK